MQWTQSARERCRINDAITVDYEQNTWPTVRKYVDSCIYSENLFSYYTFYLFK